jgi:hypothetical protein
MSSFREPSFQERQARAAEAKSRALSRLSTKQPVDDAVLAERRAAAAARDEARAKLSQEKAEARRQEKATKVRAKETALSDAAAPAPPAASEAEMKEARDARYAARKQRVAKR